jgi:hypothetical protein
VDIICIRRVTFILRTARSSRVHTGEMTPSLREFNKSCVIKVKMQKSTERHFRGSDYGCPSVADVSVYNPMKTH